MRTTPLGFWISMSMIIGTIALNSNSSALAQSHDQDPAAQRSSNVHQLPWLDVAAGFEQARRKKKLVLVDFYTNWCHWCKVIERDTYPDPAVQERLKSFVLVKANAEDGGEGQKLANENKINAYPTIGIFDSNRKSKLLMEGYKKPAKFVAKLTDFLDGKPVTDDDDD